MDLTKVEQEIIIDRINSGAEAEKVAEELHVELDVVKDFIRRAKNRGKIISSTRMGAYRMDAGIKAKVKEMYNNGATYGEIEEKTGVGYNSCQRLINYLICTGELKKRPKPRRKAVGALNIPRVKPQKPVEDTLECVGVKCTKAVMKTCRFSLGVNDVDRFCNYAEATGKCRTVINGKSGYCPPNHCTCYERRKRGCKENKDFTAQNALD